MLRQARVVIPGLPHHITQWGNNREDVFFVDENRVAYLGLLREQCEKCGTRNAECGIQNDSKLRLHTGG